LQTKSGRRPKFHLIQALRGLAASWVVLLHLEKGEHIKYFTACLPDLIDYILFRYGSAGVAIFFVLSGFVITHSLVGKDFHGHAFGRFALRRSIRLDPPYWCAIALSIAVTALLAKAHHTSIPWPSFSTLLLHVFYLQEITSAPTINIVFWTLTYEIQFYLVLAAAWWIGTRLGRAGGTPRRIQLAIGTILYLLALAAAAESRDWVPHGLFLNMWHGFAAGILAYVAGYLRRSPIPLLVLCGVMLVIAHFRAPIFDTPCALAALFLFIAGRTGLIERALSGRVWQFLGSISYSLYLTHIPTLMLGYAIWHRLTGEGLGQDIAGFALMSSLCVGVAACFWWLVERPSHKLASRPTLFGSVKPSRSARPTT
jgi:peptidoglycan/LPS O-acetylase OafA/YrhL